MAEYIEREKLLDWYSPYGHTKEPVPYENLIDDTRDMVEPDVAPVVHGRWAWLGPCNDGNGTIWGTCKACGQRQRLGDYSSYCPCCGAKMDLEG